MGNADNRVMTPQGRLSFVTLVEAKPFKPGDKPYYSTIMVFPKGTDLSALKRSAGAAADEKWPDKETRPKLTTPFRSGTEKKGMAGFDADSVFITVKTKDPPGMVDRQNRVIKDPNVFYSGCHARAVVTPWAYSTGKNHGVSFWLSSLQFLAEGERLSGGGDPTKDFEPLEPIEGEGDAAQPDNMDDPFA